MDENQRMVQQMDDDMMMIMCQSLALLGRIAIARKIVFKIGFGVCKTGVSGKSKQSPCYSAGSMTSAHACMHGPTLSYLPKLKSNKKNRKQYIQTQLFVVQHTSTAPSTSLNKLQSLVFQNVQDLQFSLSLQAAQHSAALGLWSTASLPLGLWKQTEDDEWLVAQKSDSEMDSDWTVASCAKDDDATSGNVTPKPFARVAKDILVIGCLGEVVKECGWWMQLPKCK